MTTVLLLTRQGCHLCGPARTVVAQVCQQLEVSWEEQAVDRCPQGQQRYGSLIPALLIDGRLQGYWRLEATQVRQAILGALTGTPPKE